MGNSAWCNVHLPNCSYLAHLRGGPWVMHDLNGTEELLTCPTSDRRLHGATGVQRIPVPVIYRGRAMTLRSSASSGNETKPFCQVSAKLCWITHGLQCLGGQTCLQFKRLLKCRWKLFGNYAEGEAWIMLMSVWSIEWYLPWPICIEYCLNDKRQHVFNFHRVHIILL